MSVGPGVVSQMFVFQMLVLEMSCHPERSLMRFLHQTESKDLRLHFGTSARNLRGPTLSVFDAVQEPARKLPDRADPPPR